MTTSSTPETGSFRAPAMKVVDLTGPDRSTDLGIGGTDLGAPVATSDGRILLIFGDTFDQATAGGPGWRTPTALYADPGSLSAGLRWIGAARGHDGTERRAGQLVPAPHDTDIRGFRISTQLPSDAVALGDRLYLQVMACEGLGNVHFTELYASDDDGATWATTDCWWPGDKWAGLFQNLTFCPGDDGYLYAFSTGFRRDRGLLLSRVPVNAVTDPRAWQPWGQVDGTWGWGSGPSIVLPGAFGETSLRRVEDRWVLATFDAGRRRIDVRVLSAPTDDLTTAPSITVVEAVDWDEEDHAAGRVAQPYAGYVLPGSTLDDLHLVVSQWNTDVNWPYRSMQFRADLTVALGS